MAAVVVGPVAEGHEHGGQKHEPLPTLAEDGADADANPYGEGVEGEDVGVVAFAWFVAGVVEVEVEKQSTKKVQKTKTREVQIQEEIK